MQPEILYDGLLAGVVDASFQQQWTPPRECATTLRFGRHNHSSGRHNHSSGHNHSNVDHVAHCLLGQFRRMPPLCAAPTSRLAVNFSSYPIEFGYEVFQVVPEAYALCRLGLLRLHALCAGSLPFYFFAGSSLRHVNVKECNRSSIGLGGLPVSTMTSMGQNPWRQHRRPQGQFWLRQPPFRAVYKMPTAGRVAFVYNKMGDRFKGPSGSVNSWSIRGLVDLLRQLSHACDTVVYFRAGAAAAASAMGELGGDRSYPDLTSIQAALPSVRFLQDLVPPGKAYLDRLNAAQLLLSASAIVTVGVQGGGALIASLAADRFVFLCRRGFECNGDKHFWKLYNRATIESYANEAEVTAAAVRLAKPRASASTPRALPGGNAAGKRPPFDAEHERGGLNA